MDIDVALLPQVANPADAGVCVAIDEIRASTTITTLLDGGCRAVYLAGDPPAARRLAAATGSLLVGEHHAVKPPDFDFDNSPVELAAADLRGRSVVLSTTNGTSLLARFRRSEPVLVGCTRNARAVAAAALTLAMAGSGKVRILCAGREGLFVLDDAVAAGLIAGRVADAARLAGCEPRLSDAAVAAIRLCRSWPDLRGALEASDGGETLRRIGAEPDIAYCAEEDATVTVPIVRYEGPLRAEPFEA